MSPPLKESIKKCCEPGCISNHIELLAECPEIEETILSKFKISPPRIKKSEKQPTRKPFAQGMEKTTIRSKRRPFNSHQSTRAASAFHSSDFRKMKSTLLSRPAPERLFSTVD